MRLVLILPLLAACSLSTPAPTPAPPDRLGAECRLLVEAEARLRAGAGPAHDGLTEGCPGSSARDQRPLDAQMASLRAANAARLPHDIAPGTRAETVFRRMITRGVPPTLADVLSQTEDFRIAAG